MFILKDLDKIKLNSTEFKNTNIITVEINQLKFSIKHCNENKFEKYFYKYIDLPNRKDLNQDCYTFYSINEENLCLFDDEKEKILFALFPIKAGNQNNYEPDSSNIYNSHLYAKDFLIINFEKQLLIIKDKTILCEFSDERLIGKNILLLNKSNEVNILAFYDNQMNIVFAEINYYNLYQAAGLLSKNNKIENTSNIIDMDIDSHNSPSHSLDIKILNNLSLTNEFFTKNPAISVVNVLENGTNFCMDSAMLKPKDTHQLNQSSHNNLFNKNNNGGINRPKIYSVCGERGKSKLITYEKALVETRLSVFNYNHVRDVILAENFDKSEKILFINTFMDTKSFFFGVTNGQIKFYQLAKEAENIYLSANEITLDAFFLLENKKILQITNKSIYLWLLKDRELLINNDKVDNNSNINLDILDSQFLNNNKQLLLLENIPVQGGIYNTQEDSSIGFLTNIKFSLKKIYTEDSDTNIISIKHYFSKENNCIYIILIFSTFKISIFKYDGHKQQDSNSTSMLSEEITFDYYTTISCFDLTIIQNSLILVLGTYDNKLEILNYDIHNKTFFDKSEFLLELENSVIVPESIKICENKNFVFISTRIGKFLIFALDSSTVNLNFLGSFIPKNDEIEPLIITDCSIKENFLYEITLKSTNNCYLLELKFSADGKNLEPSINKYLVEKRLLENKSSETSLYEYENSGIKNTINFFLNLYYNDGNSSTVISVYQNNNLICFSHFDKIMENSYIANKVKLYEKKNFAKKILALNDSNVVVLYNQIDRDSLRWGLHVLNIKDLKEKFYKIEKLNELKINVMKTFLINYSNVDFSDEENLFEFLILGGEYSDNNNQKKGIFFIYRIDLNINNYISLEYVKKFGLADLILDVCQLNDYLIFACENKICCAKIDIDDINRKFDIVARNQQNHMNKTISCESVPQSNYIIAGDVSESFNLMELDKKAIKFDLIACDMSLRSLYKGLIFFENKEINF